MTGAQRIHLERAYQDAERDQRRERLTRTDAYGFGELKRRRDRDEAERFEAADLVTTVAGRRP